MSAFLRFALVGGAGFFVNEAALWVAIHLLHLGKDLAWFFAFLPSVTFTWWGNRTLTFREHASDNLLAEWARFVATNSVGAAVNLATYEALTHFLNCGLSSAISRLKRPIMHPGIAAFWP